MGKNMSYKELSPSIRSAAAAQAELDELMFLAKEHGGKVSMSTDRSGTKTYEVSNTNATFTFDSPAKSDDVAAWETYLEDIQLSSLIEGYEVRSSSLRSSEKVLNSPIFELQPDVDFAFANGLV